MKGYGNMKGSSKGGMGHQTNQPTGNHADNGGWKPRVKGADKSTGRSAKGGKVKY